MTRRTVMSLRSLDRTEIVVCDAPDDALPVLSGRDWWTDDTTPRTDCPLQFVSIDKRPAWTYPRSR